MSDMGMSKMGISGFIVNGSMTRTRFQSEILDGRYGSDGIIMCSVCYLRLKV